MRTTFFYFFIKFVPDPEPLASLRQPKGYEEGDALRLPPRKLFFKEKLDQKKTLRGLWLGRDASVRPKPTATSPPPPLRFSKARQMTFFKESQQRIASFFMVKNLDQETNMPKAQWKVFWRCKRGRPMEGRPRTSTLSFSLSLVCSPILNGIVIFYVF